MHLSRRYLAERAQGGTSQGDMALCAICHRHCLTLARAADNISIVSMAQATARPGTLIPLCTRMENWMQNARKDSHLGDNQGKWMKEESKANTSVCAQN